MRNAEMNTRLEKFYKDEVVPKLMEKFGYTNPMQVPRLSKITLNMGVGEAATNKKVLENAVADMAKVSGQKPIVRSEENTSELQSLMRNSYAVFCLTTKKQT